MGSSVERGRALRRFRVGTHVVANRAIDYTDVDVRVDAGDKGVVVAPELVQPIVRVVWDDHPARSFTTNVGSLEPCEACAAAPGLVATRTSPTGRRERDRAKASGERVCRVCACSDLDACPGGCIWVAPDLCSACEGDAQ